MEREGEWVGGEEDELLTEEEQERLDLSMRRHPSNVPQRHEKGSSRLTKG